MSHEHAAALTARPDGTFRAECACGWTNDPPPARGRTRRYSAVQAGIAAGDHLTHAAIRSLLAAVAG